MKTWFNRLNIQSKLFTVFGILILICTLAIGFNLLNTAQIGTQSEVLDRLFRTVREYYQAQDTLQKMDLAEKSFIAQGYDSHLDAFDNYSAQMETFIRQALIKASSLDEKNILVALQEALQSHTANFQAIIPAVYEEDWESVDAQQEVLFDEISSLNAKINAILEEDYIVFEDIDTLQYIAQVGAFFISSIALIFFVVSALIAAIVLNSQFNQPSQQLIEAVEAIEKRQFDPATLQKLTGRQEEMGQLARAIVDMAAAMQQREQALQQQADEIRAKIHQREENRLTQQEG